MGLDLSWNNLTGIIPENIGGSNVLGENGMEFANVILFRCGNIKILQWRS